MNIADKTSFYSLPSYLSGLFGNETELLPSADELFELELAYLEYNSLPKEEQLSRLAYFKSVDGKDTEHYLMYRDPLSSLTNERTAETKSYFENGLFSTGYATHGLFPYRGKFHPQLIKALINIIGINVGEMILDPMCGSGTANIEAALMGINSYAVDASPFCQFMTKVKHESLLINPVFLKGISKKSDELFDFFSTNDINKQLERVADINKCRTYNLALLAFLDALGYSKRVSTSTHQQLFIKVLKRYEDTVLSFIERKSIRPFVIGKLQVLNGSIANHISLEDESVDGIITSPPYSFAIDYVRNDEAQLKYFGCDIDKIRINMIGLRGKNKDERLENYFADMDKTCAEMARVLKNERFLVMIIGSNTNQTGGIRLEKRIIESCQNHNLRLVKTILKPIKGLRNTMKDEYILFFQKELNQ